MFCVLKTAIRNKQCEMIETFFTKKTFFILGSIDASIRGSSGDSSRRSFARRNSGPPPELLLRVAQQLSVPR